MEGGGAADRESSCLGVEVDGGTRRALSHSRCHGRSGVWEADDGALGALA